MGQLAKVHIENFKSIESLELDLAPLTILIGPNGAGKSSVLQALMILKRFLFAAPSLSPDKLGDFSEWNYSNLGRYDELMFLHDSTRSIGIEVKINEANTSVTFSLSLKGDKGRSSIAFDQGNPISLEIPLPYKDRLTKRGRATFEDGSTYSIIWDGVKAVIELLGKTPPPDRLADILRLHLKTFQGLYLVHLKQAFHNWSYVPMSSVDYDKPSLSDTELANILSADSDIQEKVASWLKEVTGTEVTTSYYPLTLFGGLKVETRWKKLRIPLSSEGLGLNRLVYLLTSLAMKQTTVLLVEEPEAHLHPRWLAQVSRRLPHILADEGKQMIVSTHSEHFILPLLSGVAKGTIDPESFAIYYLEKHDRLTTRARRLRINANGQIEGGLPGFFEADWETLQEYLSALAKGTG